MNAGRGGEGFKRIEHGVYWAAAMGREAAGEGLRPWGLGSRVQGIRERKGDGGVGTLGYRA